MKNVGQINIHYRRFMFSQNTESDQREREREKMRERMKEREREREKNI